MPIDVKAIRRLDAGAKAASMGTTRLALYLIGLLVIVTAVWVGLTQTPLGRQVPGSVALVLILLIVGIGVMASARNINESRRTRRVVHDGPARPYDTRYAAAPPPPAAGYVAREYVAPPVEGETIVDERRYD